MLGRPEDSSRNEMATDDREAALKRMIEASEALKEVEHRADDDPEKIERKAAFQKAKAEYWAALQSD